MHAITTRTLTSVFSHEGVIIISITAAMLFCTTCILHIPAVQATGGARFANECSRSALNYCLKLSCRLRDGASGNTAL